MSVRSTIPTYSWLCQTCSRAWDVVSTVAARDNPELCGNCGNWGARQITMARISVTAGDWNNVSYNPALGQWTTSQAHARRIAKERGMEEIGNDISPEALHVHGDKDRAATAAERWKVAEREAANDPNPDLG